MEKNDVYTHPSRDGSTQQSAAHANIVHTTRTRNRRFDFVCAQQSTFQSCSIFQRSSKNGKLRGGSFDFSTIKHSRLVVHLSIYPLRQLLVYHFKTVTISILNKPDGWHTCKKARLSFAVRMTITGRRARLPSSDLLPCAY